MELVSCEIIRDVRLSGSCRKELAYLWLAILLHDVGMFVSTKNEKQKLLDSDAYKDFLRHHLERMEDAGKRKQRGIP